MKTAIKNEALHALEATAENVLLKPVIRKCAEFWLDVINAGYTDEVTQSCYSECHELVCSQVEMLYAFWCAAVKAHATNRSFEDWVSYEDIGKVEAEVFMAIVYEDEFKLVAPCSVLTKMTFQVCGYEFKLMHNAAGNRMVIAEIHSLPISL